MNTYAAYFARNSRVVFLMSGGKDSVAAFHLLKDFWPQLHVFWVNTGEAYAEIERNIRAVESLVGSFTEIRSDVVKWREDNAWPTDVLPIRTAGRYHELLTNQPKRLRLCLSTECCDANKGLPLEAAISAFKPSGIVAGMRRDERFGPATASYTIVNGIEFLYPVENWREKQVASWLQQKGLWEDYMEASSDCRRCTGHWTGNQHDNRFTLLSRQGYTDDCTFVMRKMWEIRGAISDDLDNMFAEMELE